MFARGANPLAERSRDREAAGAGPEVAATVPSAATALCCVETHHAEANRPTAINSTTAYGTRRRGFSPSR